MKICSFSSLFLKEKLYSIGKLKRTASLTVDITILLLAVQQFNLVPLELYIHRWLNNVSGVCLVHVSLLFIGQQGLGHFFRYRPLHPIGWRTVQIVRQCRKKITNTAPTTLGAIQSARQYTFINAKLYSTCD
jgi:hypothetical protein